MGIAALRKARHRKERENRRRQRRDRPDLGRYRLDPVGYARDVLGITLWQPIAAALLALLEPPYVVDVDSGHGVGKTHGAAVAINWWYDTRHPAAVVITTAPTLRDVVDLLWTEIRLQRRHARIPLADDLQPSAPEMRSSEEHYAKGYTARKGESFQGRHRRNMLFVFDEKEGVEGTYWTATKSMLRPGSGDAWLRIGNPTTTTSVAYQERRTCRPDGAPACHLVRLSSLDHPNVAAGLRGEPPPVAGAVTAEQVEQWVGDWCDPVGPGDERPTDITWKGRTYRPGPIGEPRILGLRPSAGTFGVWSEALWALTGATEPAIPVTSFPVIGCDCANYGVDFTCFHVRCGAVSLAHEAYNGWSHDRIASHLIDLCRTWAAWATARRDAKLAPVDPKTLQIRLDDDATGRAVSTLVARQGHTVLRLNAQRLPMRPDLYPNLRSELWFVVPKLAALGLVNLSRLDRAARQRLELQALAPEWWPDTAGRRVVESKDDLRKPERMGRSPDDMDALNLAYYPLEAGGLSAVVPERKMERRDGAESRPHRGERKASSFGRR